MMDLVAAGLDELHERIAGRFARAEPRARVREYVSGLVTGLERKNGWTLAEWAGEVSPDGMQRLLRRADSDVDGVRDDVRAYVVEQLGDADGVLIADDTGFLKKGTRSAGVQRQYSGTAGRTENCQVGVFLAYASRFGHALIDRELYVPQPWAGDPERCRAAGIPEEAEFTTKPRQAQAMIARAVAWCPCTLADRFPLCRIYIRNVNRFLKTQRTQFPQAALFPDAVVIPLDVVKYRGPGLFSVQP